MRVLKETNLSTSIKATIFSWNGKFLVKLESGNLEQTFKIPETDVAGLPDIEQFVSNPEFLSKAEKIFLDMDSALDLAYDS
jgi:hypothetical protein